ncbi:n-acetyltransferase domain-containing protein [Trichonephila clavata]|uniref:N-acetyltransferase domain-containing protein n=1 Tax=Trichonephila clavata TaxID=2740835 RepID=A0A8X6GBM3_TRICU|nr:n-acetyltransferase domain-containing protein [Trichonephila clavata]
MSKGQIIGSLFTVKNTENMYTGGTFCIKENYRHLDIGRKLIQETLIHYQGKNLVGNVVANHIESFKRRGFVVLESEWKSLEYETDTSVNPSILSDELPSGVEILPFQNSLLPAIFEYDYSLIGFERRTVIEASCKEENSKTLVAMKDGKCVGLGSIKLNINEQGRIGPLYADYPSVAEALVKRLITAMPEAKGFAIVTINTNMFANMILDKLSIPVYKSFYRLYTKERLHVDTKKVFAHLDVDFNSF